MSDGTTPDVLFYLTILLAILLDLHKLNLSTLVPQGSCSVFYATRRQFTVV